MLFAVALAEHAADDLRIDHQASFSPQAKSPEPPAKGAEEIKAAVAQVTAQEKTVSEVKTSEKVSSQAEVTSKEIVLKTFVEQVVPSVSVIEKSAEKEVIQTSDANIQKTTVTETSITQAQQVSEDTKSSSVVQIKSESTAVIKEGISESSLEKKEEKSTAVSVEKKAVSQAESISVTSTLAAATEKTETVTESKKESKEQENLSQISTPETLKSTETTTAAAQSVVQAVAVSGEVKSESITSTQVVQAVQTKAIEVDSSVKKEDQATLEKSQTIQTSDQTGAIAESESANQEVNMSRKYSSSSSKKMSSSHIEGMIKLLDKIFV